MAKMRGNKKSSGTPIPPGQPFSQTPNPPILGPAAPGQWNVEYMHDGKQYRYISGKSVPQRRADMMSGRTVEAGTRPLLEGMKSFMRGGGLRRGSM